MRTQHGAAEQSTARPATGPGDGGGFFYYLTIGSILVVLSLSANTAFADFPRLCRAIAHVAGLPGGRRELLL